MVEYRATVGANAASVAMRETTNLFIPTELLDHRLRETSKHLIQTELMNHQVRETSEHLI